MIIKRKIYHFRPCLEKRPNCPPAVGRSSPLEADAGAGLGVVRPPTLLLALSGRTWPAVVRTTLTTGEGPLAPTSRTQGRGGLRGGGGGSGDSDRLVSPKEGTKQRSEMKTENKVVM